MDGHNGFVGGGGGGVPEDPIIKRLGADWVPPEAWKVIVRKCPDLGTRTPSPRHMQAFWGVAGHRTDKQVSEVMGRTERTARAHREELCRRLGCHDREELLICVAKAVIQVLTRPPP